jgi:alpha-tubulin suppressor-like RCC1 family protein
MPTIARSVDHDALCAFDRLEPAPRLPGPYQLRGHHRARIRHNLSGQPPPPSEAMAWGRQVEQCAEGASETGGGNSNQTTSNYWGSSISCGGTTAGESRPFDPAGDAGKTSAASCTGAMALSSGSQGDAACIVKSDGSLWCWGANGCGSIGVTGAQFSAAPMAVPRHGLASGVKSVSVGWGTTCAVERSGAAACWGNSLPGDVSSCLEMPTPTPISGLPSNTSVVATGNDHACAISEDGSAWCWGTNTVGQLGDGTTVDRSTVAQVIGLTSGVAAISTGSSDSCAVKADG